MTQRIEINPGEWFLINPRSIHVTEYESVFAMTSKIGTTENDQLAYLITFTGRVNNSKREETHTMIMSPQDAMRLLDTLLDQFEWLKDA